MTVLAGAAAYPLLAGAQQKARPVVGFLGASSPGPAAPFVAAFLQGLSAAGYVEGQNVAIEYRWAERRSDRRPALAAELVTRKVNVIATTGGTPSALAAKTTTSTIPIVFLSGDDPVERGLVASLDRPGGNLTGISILNAAPMARRLDLIAELVPQTRVIVLLVNPNNPGADRTIGDAQETAHAKGVELHVIRAGNGKEIDDAFETLTQLHADGLVATGFFSLRERLLAQTARHAIPAIYDWREFAATGGLISYGASLMAVTRRLGTYAGRILDGAKPADLPIEQLAEFELVVNLKTAKALGLTVPPAILARADEVIE
jgi:putative ABC transport system substrate-binding protein